MLITDTIYKFNEEPCIRGHAIHFTHYSYIISSGSWKQHKLCSLAAGDNHLLCIELLRAGVEQGGLPEAMRELLGEAVRSVHGRSFSYPAPHLQATSRSGRIIGHEGTTQSDHDGPEILGSNLPQPGFGSKRFVLFKWSFFKRKCFANKFYA